MSEKTKYIYFQYFKDAGLPIFIKTEAAAFGMTLQDFMAKMKFQLIPEKDHAGVENLIRSQTHARVLSITEATHLVAKQIEQTAESDKYGPESITPKEGYKVYRYKGCALIVYSFGAKEWQMGCYENFGSKKTELASRIVLNRFLSWALAPLGIVGFWGVPIDDGVVVQRSAEAVGEAVFFDVMAKKIFTLDGEKKWNAKFKILRLDPILKGRNIKMSGEELLSFLSSHTSFFDYSGLSVPVRQMIQVIAKSTEGLVHPQESFKPRTDLSL